MKAYKLTDSNGQTKNNTQWGIGVTHSAVGSLKVLCSSGWIHFYKDPILAIIMNPIHANFNNPKLWECETSGKHLHEPLKSGCKTLTTIKEIPIPKISNVQKVIFAILCAKKIYKAKKWNAWADKWISGEDRTETSADAILKLHPNLFYNEAYYATYSTKFCDRDYNYYAIAAARTTSFINSKIDFAKIAKKAITYKS